MPELREWHPGGVAQERVVFGLALLFVVAIVAVVCGSMYLGAELATGHQARQVLAQKTTIDSLTRELVRLDGLSGRLAISCSTPPRRH